NGEDDESTGNAAYLGKRALCVRDVLQYLEQGYYIEGAIREWQGRRIALQRHQRRHATFMYRLQIGDAEGEQIYCGDHQGGKGIEQWPEEGATAAANVKQASRVHAVQDTQHAAHTRQLHGTLEAMQAQTCLTSHAEHGAHLVLGEGIQRAVKERAL